MDYYKILNLKREPFSNSPDPDYFYKSRQHLGCLQKLELALRLRRGLNVVVGHVGTGKTTLCRELIRSLSADPQIETHLILDPSFGTPRDFLLSVFEMLSDDRLPEAVDDWQLKEMIKQHLFRKGVDEDKIIVLIIDEGQKIPSFCIEILREFLNYETNDHKLLQIALFAQKEFEQVLADYPNFADRVNLLHQLEPMNFRDTRQMIQHRLKQSSQTPRPPALFTFSAYRAIYRASKGYPRKIINLCHQSVLAMIIQNQSKAGRRLVNSCIRRAIAGSWQRSYKPLSLLLLILVVALSAWIWLAAQGHSVSEFLARNRTAQGTVPAHPIPPEPTTVKVEMPVPDGRPSPTEDIPTSTAANPPTINADPAATETLNSNRRNEDSGHQMADPAATGISAKAEIQRPVGFDRPPLILGTLSVQKGDTLIRMIRDIQGKFSPQYLQQLLRLNPQIRDPNTIEVGTTVIFPAATTPASSSIDQFHWIELDNRGSLREAYDRMLAFGAEKRALSLIPYWNPHDGLRFAVVLREFFLDPQSAGARLRLLPQKPGRQGKIVSAWNKETLFFTNLF